MTLLAHPTTDQRPGTFVDRLAAFDGTPALLDGDGRQLTYRELDRAVTDVARRLGPNRRLALVHIDNSLDAVVGYLGALRAGNAVLLVASDADVDELVAIHRPDVFVAAGPSGVELVTQRDETAHELHPDLALLLSTSGSTGSSKLVRLSHENIDSNARAIADFLALTPEDRGITTLPLHYCFGLSVLHSHLAVGASTVLTDRSVVDPCFWSTVDRTGPTSLAAVPHTIELLDRVGFTDRSVPSVRAVLQAGGRLAPERVRSYAEAGERRGWDLFVMYGQTEATARMAYLPPDLAIDRPGAVGVAIPGGRIRIEPCDDVEAPAGEVVYDGPNVMLGYAESPADLRRGADVTELRTGDIGVVTDDGLLEIVGRRSDFVKLFGLRIDLGRVRHHLACTDVDAIVDGDDEGMVVGVCDDTDPGVVRTSVSEQFGIPESAIAVGSVAELPLLPSGKTDRTALRATVRASGSSLVAEADIRSVLASSLGIADIRPDDTFVSLGGDSLSYVEVSIRLEAAIGHLPTDWHLRTVAELELRSGEVPGRRAPRVETNVFLRAIAIVLIVGNHAGAFLVPGGAHVLFAAAGFNFGRFRSAPSARWRSIARIAVPSMLWIGGAAAFRDDFDLVHGLLLHGLLDGTGRWMYWFIEALVVVLAGLAVLLSIPGVRRLEQRAPFGFACAMLAVAALPRFDVVDIGPAHHAVYRPQEIAWLFALGWAMSRAGSAPRLLLLSAAAAIGVVGYFGDPTREAIVLGGLLLLAWVPRIAVPRPLHRLVGAVASASLYIYLSHVQVFPEFDDPWVAIAASLTFGVALWAIATPAMSAAERRISQMQLSRN